MRAHAAEQPPAPAADAPRAHHEWYARTFGYFWLPCPLCAVMFGGHEWLTDLPRLRATIPSRDGLHLGEGICPACTRDGRGNSAWTEHAAAHPAGEPDG